MHLDIFHNTISLISISNQDTGKAYAQEGDVFKLVHVVPIGGEDEYSNKAVNMGMKKAAGKDDVK